MAGEQFNKVTFRQMLRFDAPTIQNFSQALVTADGNDVSYSAQTNGGVPRIKLSHGFPSPDAVPSVPVTGNKATVKSAEDYLLALANAFVLVRSFRQTRQGDGLVTIVRAYHSDVSKTSQINISQLLQYIQLPAKSTIIGSSYINFKFAAPWSQMQNDFAVKIDDSWTYCHGNFPPPCHGSRGRR